MQASRTAPAFVDVHYLDQPLLIACGILETREGLVLIDPGPSVSMPALARALEERGASLRDVHAVLVTHIHLDHAGCVGSLVRQHPGIRVMVHAIGARHLVAPERLLKSAARIYGNKMDTLWGAFEPVPVANITSLEGGERFTFGTTHLRVAYTPGHAVHHVSYLDEESGCAYVGDTAGMRVHGCDYVLPVTPPPDVHLEQWNTSLQRIEDWRPDWLFTTHFGPHTGVAEHLNAMREGLDTLASSVDASLNDDAADAELAAAFEAEVHQQLKDNVPEPFCAVYQYFGQPAFSWYGMARYLRKRKG